MRLRTFAVSVALAGAVVVLRAATPPALNESLVGRQVFPTNNWWNADVTAVAVDSRSAALIDFISGRTPTNPRRFVICIRILVPRHMDSPT